MKVRIRTPYSLEKNLGKAYNEEMALIPEGESACFIDGDVNFLTPNYGAVLHDYATKYPNAVLTCYATRIHELAKGQLYPVSDNMRDCIIEAHMLSENVTATPITGPVSGFLLLIPKHIWKAHPFCETNTFRPGTPNLLGCDNEWTNRIRKAGVDILRMNSMLVWHTYRLISNGTDKSHLQ
jgi:hypothetical protein